MLFRCPSFLFAKWKFSHLHQPKSSRKYFKELWSKNRQIWTILPRVFQACLDPLLNMTRTKSLPFCGKSASSKKIQLKVWWNLRGRMYSLSSRSCSKLNVNRITVVVSQRGMLPHGSHKTNTGVSMAEHWHGEMALILPIPSCDSQQTSCCLTYCLKVSLENAT